MKKQKTRKESLKEASVEEIVSHPTTFFKKPEEVIECDRLNADQKIKVLESWKFTSLQKLKSADEGMTGADDNQLTAVSKAISHLDEMQHSYH